MRNVRSHDGLVHLVYVSSFADQDIITMCTRLTDQPHWTGRTIDRTSPYHVEHVDDAATCVQCIGHVPW